MTLNILSTDQDQQIYIMKGDKLLTSWRIGFSPLRNPSGLVVLKK